MGKLVNLRLIQLLQMNTRYTQFGKEMATIKTVIEETTCDYCKEPMTSNTVSKHSVVMSYRADIINTIDVSLVGNLPYRPTRLGPIDICTSCQLVALNKLVKQLEGVK